MRRLSFLTLVLVVLLAMMASSTAHAQDDGADEGDETPVETLSYGDSELIDSLRAYGLLDDWLEASTVSPQAALALVAGSSGYESQRQVFLDSVERWAARTEQVREDLARIDAAQASSDQLRSIITQVRDALVFDDRLATDSNTLVEIEHALTQLADVQTPDHTPGGSEAPMILAEIQLNDLQELAGAELNALNGVEPAFTSSGIQAFVGFEDLRVGLNQVDLLIERGRELVRPAREESEQLVLSVLRQIPALHGARLVESTDVAGMSVVTVDAYVRAAAMASCSIDWALLAGIGQIESNHGRIEGASVSRSGQVSTSILGPLLDGGQTEREAAAAGLGEGEQIAVAVAAVLAEALAPIRQATQENFEDSLISLLPGFSDVTDREGEPWELGNGFAVIVDTDGGLLDGNERWDRAIGPMQFLPETWTRWATDGNGDGVSDPHNLYDAAASAARFLCDLRATRGTSPSTFLLGYNSSTSYVRSVLAVAQGLRSKALPVP